MLLASSVQIAHGKFIETLSNGSDDGNWHSTSDSNRLLQIEQGSGIGAWVCLSSYGIAVVLLRRASLGAAI